MNNISPEVAYFIKKMNLMKTSQRKERYIIGHIKSLFLNRDMVIFLKEFTTVYEGEKRMQMLLYLKKIIRQNPTEIDPEHYKAFEEEYNEDIANDTIITGIDWIDAEIKFIEDGGQPDLILRPASEPKSSNVNSRKPLLDLSDQNDLLTLSEILKLLEISKSTFDRRRADGLPCLKIGKKIYVDKNKLADWLQSQGANVKRGNIKFSGK